MQYQQWFYYNIFDASQTFALNKDRQFAVRGYAEDDFILKRGRYLRGRYLHQITRTERKSPPWGDMTRRSIANSDAEIVAIPANESGYAIFNLGSWLEPGPVA